MEAVAPPPKVPLAAWLVRRRRQLLAELKRAERERTGSLPAPLRAYSRRFLKEFRSRPPRPCEMARVESAVAGADIVFSADYHASPRPERTHLRWLELLLRSGRPTTLALELVSSRHQRLLDAFARRELSAEELRRRARLDQEWGFPWPPYRHLLRQAARRGCRLLALDHPGRACGATVRTRDEHAGARLAREHAARPGRALLVVAGEMHLAEPHLPAATRRACRARDLRARVVTLFHGSEGLYFMVGRHGLEGSVAALDLGHDRYCLLHAAPWMRLLAHLHWLEQQEHEQDVSADPVERVVSWTARTLAALAGVPLPGRLHPQEEGLGRGASDAERIAAQAVAVVEEVACQRALAPATRRLWISLARCLVDPPLPAGAGLEEEPDLDGLRIYRGLVDGTIGAAEVRAALS